MFWNFWLSNNLFFVLFILSSTLSFPILLICTYYFFPLLFMLVLEDLPCLYLYTALSFLFYSTVLAVTFAVNVASYCSLIQTISIRPCQNKRLSSSQSLYLHLFCHNASSFCYYTQFSYCFSLCFTPCDFLLTPHPAYDLTLTISQHKKSLVLSLFPLAPYVTHSFSQYLTPSITRSLRLRPLKGSNPVLLIAALLLTLSHHHSHQVCQCL